MHALGRSSEKGGWEGEGGGAHLGTPSPALPSPARCDPQPGHKLDVGAFFIRHKETSSGLPAAAPGSGDKMLWPLRARAPGNLKPVLKTS